MRECYIRFRATVDPMSAQQLLNIVDDKYRNGYQKIHLLISTPGGTVKDGIDIYNYLKSIAIEVYTYNIGQVDSIGIILYCAGNKRFSVPHARFLLHPVGLNTGNERYDEHLLSEKLNSLKIDQQNISRVVAFTTGRKEEEILKMIHSHESISPESAKREKLVEEIKSEIIPGGAEIIAIEQQFANQGQPIFHMPANMGVTPANNTKPFVISGIW